MEQATPGYIRVFASVDEWVHRAERFLLCLVLILMIAVVFADFAMREMRVGGLAWSKAAATYAMVWVGFLGASLATRSRKHLKVDASEKIIPKRFRMHMAGLVGLIAALFCFYLAYLGGIVVHDSMVSGKKSPVMDLRIWVVQAAIPFSCTLMGLRFLLQDAAGNLYRIVKGLPPPDSGGLGHGVALPPEPGPAAKEPS